MILINVGVSGIGLAAVDLATNVFRAKVFFFIYVMAYHDILFLKSTYILPLISTSKERILNRMQNILHI